MNEIILTRESSEEQIKQYFNEILNLSQSNNEYPINMDEVWMLVYNQKSDAVEALKRDFIESVDYKVLRQNPQNPNGGRPVNEYYISLSCLEFFIARKVRPVFEIYRKVFHGVISQVILPKTFAEALQLAADQAKEIEKQQLLIEEQKPKVDFYDDVVDSKDAIDMAKVAKTLNMGIGRNNLFQFLRDKKVLMQNNTPYQYYVDNQWFRCVESRYTKPNGDICINIKTVVLQKGLDGIRKLLKER